MDFLKSLLFDVIPPSISSEERPTFDPESQEVYSKKLSEGTDVTTIIADSVNNQNGITPPPEMYSSEDDEVEDQEEEEDDEEDEEEGLKQRDKIDKAVQEIKRVEREQQQQQQENVLVDLIVPDTPEAQHVTSSIFSTDQKSGIVPFTFNAERHIFLMQQAADDNTFNKNMNELFEDKNEEENDDNAFHKKTDNNPDQQLPQLVTTLTTEEFAEQRRVSIIQALPPDIKLLTEIKEICASPWKEITQEPHRAYLDRNLLDLCINLRTSSPSLRQVYNRLIIEESDTTNLNKTSRHLKERRSTFEKVITSDLECDLKWNDRNTRDEEISISLINNNTKDFQSLDACWPIRAFVTEARVNFEESFQIALDVFSEKRKHGFQFQWVSCQPTDDYLVFKNNEEDDRRCLPYGVYIGNSGALIEDPGDAKRFADYLWSCYLIDRDRTNGSFPKMPFEAFTPCAKKDLAIWPRTLQNYIILKDLVENGGSGGDVNQEQQLVDIAKRTLASSTLREFKMKESELLKIVEYAKKRASTFSPPSIKIKMRLLNEDRLNTVKIRSPFSETNQVLDQKGEIHVFLKINLMVRGFRNEPEQKEIELLSPSSYSSSPRSNNNIQQPRIEDDNPYNDNSSSVSPSILSMSKQTPEPVHFANNIIQNTMTNMFSVKDADKQK